MTLQLISATLKMICSLTLIICNHYGIKCLCNRLQLEPWNVMFKVISDIMADWYDMWNIIVIAINCCNGKKMNCALFIIRNQDAISYLSNLLQLERCNVLFNVISDITAHWYHIWNTIVIATIFCNAKKTICALMFIKKKLNGIKCLSNLVQLELCNVMFKVISDIMAHWYDTWNISVIAIKFYYAKKMICTMMFIICNDGIKCHSNLL